MVRVTFTFGIVVRRRSLQDRGVSELALFDALDVDRPLDSSPDILSFGPHFGGDAAKALCKRLDDLGLVYVDDYFDLSLDHPEWLSFAASFEPVR